MKTNNLSGEQKLQNLYSLKIAVPGFTAKKRENVRDQKCQMYYISLYNRMPVRFASQTTVQNQDICLP